MHVVPDLQMTFSFNVYPVVYFNFEGLLAMILLKNC